MYLKRHNATTPGVRFKYKIKNYLLQTPRFTQLRFGKTNFSGRNFSGKITVRHRQGGSKKNYPIIDYTRNKFRNLAVCVELNYNVNITSYIALIKYANGAFSYILAPQGLFYGDYVLSTYNDMLYTKGFSIGYAIFLFHAPVTTIFFNIKLTKARRGFYARAAGAYCTIFKENREKAMHHILLPTTKEAVISSYSLVTLGKVSNKLHKKEVVGKAGLNRLKGFRPTVRGVAMNPVDHPHGGRTKTISPEVTPWGKVAKRCK